MRRRLDGRDLMLRSQLLRHQPQLLFRPHLMQAVVRLVRRRELLLGVVVVVLLLHVRVQHAGQLC